MKKKQIAVLIETAKCIGSKVFGIYDAMEEEARCISNEAAILVPSDTPYNGNNYKLAIKKQNQWTCISVKDNEFDIIKLIN
jgi:hypothetical protein